MIVVHVLLLLAITHQCLGSDFFSCDSGPGPHKYCLFDSGEYFECDDGSCVCRAAQCDGNTDCPDGSDEAAAECDAIIYGVIIGVAGLALLCCVLPCLCCCCYYLRKCRKRTKLLNEETPLPQRISSTNHTALTAKNSADIKEITRPAPAANKTTEV